mgnify:CR=1 FL=1
MVEPLRYTPKAAANALLVDPETVYRLIKDGTFTAVRPMGRGPGKRVYLVGDEVRAFATGGKEGVERLRAKKAK